MPARRVEDIVSVTQTLRSEVSRLKATLARVPTNIDALGNVVVTAVGGGELLTYNAGTSNWRNQTLAEAGVAAVGVPASWTPTLDATTTAPGLGTGGTTTGGKLVIDAKVDAWVRWLFGTSPTAGSGQYFVTLPETADTTFLVASANTGSVIGHGTIYDADTNWANFEVVLATSTTGRFKFVDDAAAGRVANDAPFAWAAGDSIALNLSYLK